MGVRWSRMSWSDRNELWARWRRGESVRQIAYGLRRASSVIHTVVAAEGGIAPRTRRRSRVALTPAEREEISRHLASGQSLRAISRMLGRAPSTLSREVADYYARQMASYRPVPGQWNPGDWSRTHSIEIARDFTSSAPALSAIDASRPAQNRGVQTRAAVVATADLGLASMHLSE